MKDKEKLREKIRRNYSQVALKGSRGCCCSPGCCGGDPAIKNSGFINIHMIPKDNSKDIIKSWVPGKSAEEFVASYIIEAQKSESK